MKQCTKCKEWKSLSEFAESKTSKDGLRYWCKECMAIRWKLWYQANKDKKRERDREYQRANPDKKREYNKRFREKSPEKASATTQRWRENHPEEYKARSRTDGQRWYKNNPEAVKVRSHRRRTHKINSSGNFTAEEWEALCKQYDYLCLCCKEQKPLTVDHVIPISKGGTNNIDNIQPLCQSCNCRKKDRSTDYRY